MEITLRIVLDLSPAVSAAVEALKTPAAAIAAPCRPAPEQPARLNQLPQLPQLNQLNQQPEPQPEQPQQQPEPQPEQQPQQPELQQPELQQPELQQPELQQPEQPAQQDKPEDVLPLLRERFNIPAAKEERTEEQQTLAKALNKAVVAVIREVTKNGAARSIADLRTEDDRQEFIRLALLLYYNVSTQQFEVKPF